METAEESLPRPRGTTGGLGGGSSAEVDVSAVEEEAILGRDARLGSAGQGRTASGQVRSGQVETRRDKNETNGERLLEE